MRGVRHYRRGKRTCDLGHNSLGCGRHGLPSDGPFHVARRARGLGVDGVRVRATGGFDPVSWSSTGVEYEVEVASEAGDGEIERLLAVVDEVAEIPRALRAGAAVARRRAP